MNCIYNWEIKTIHATGGGHGLEVYLVNKNNGYEIRVPNDKLEIFGYTCYGPEAGILSNNKEEKSEKEQISALIYILSEELNQQSKVIDYHTLEVYLKNERKSNYKIENNSIYKTFQIIKDEFQNIFKYKLKIIDKDRIFNKTI